jgi:intein-encoded DNA endonuclease-like protein
MKKKLERIEVYKKAMRLRRAGVKLKEIASVVGVPLPTVREWARGLYRPSMYKQSGRMSASRRVKSYEKALELKRKGIGPTQIAKITGVPYGTILNWIYGIHKPPHNRVDFSKRYELGYVAGAQLSDGSTSLSKGFVGILCKDRDFAELFSQAVAKVHGRKKLYSIWKDKGGYFGVACRGWVLAEFLSDLKAVEKLLEDEEFNRGFLKGYFDGDGSANKQIEVSGAKERIELLTKALNKLGIETSKPWIKNRAGKAIFRGKYTSKQDTWGLRIPMRQGHARRFAEKVGFGIRRKERRLIKLVGQRSMSA